MNPGTFFFLVECCAGCVKQDRYRGERVVSWKERGNRIKAQARLEPASISIFHVFETSHFKGKIAHILHFDERWSCSVVLIASFLRYICQVIIRFLLLIKNVSAAFL